MQSVMPIKRVNSYQTESKSNNTTAYVPHESSVTKEWNWLHPSIQESFYLKLTAPTDGEDARIKMSCHEHAIEDFNLQLEMNALEINMLSDGEEVLPYN